MFYIPGSGKLLQQMKIPQQMLVNWYHCQCKALEIHPPFYTANTQVIKINKLFKEADQTNYSLHIAIVTNNTSNVLLFTILANFP